MKKYVITCITPNSTDNEEALETIFTYLEEEKIPLKNFIVLPTATSRKENFNMSETLSTYLRYEDRIKLNDKLEIRNLRVRHTVMDPTTGLEYIDKNFILPAPRLIEKTQSQLMRDYADIKNVACTGTLSNPDNYKAQKNQIRLKEFHTRHTGAIIVEIKDNRFYNLRQLFYDYKTKSICDFPEEEQIKQYFSNGKVKRKLRASWNLGDSHFGHETDIFVHRKTIHLLKKSRAKDVAFQDFFDCSGYYNHHAKGQYITQSFLAKINPTLEFELENCGSYAMDYLQDATLSRLKTNFHVISANHNEALDRYLNEGRFLKHPQDVKLGFKLGSAQCDGHSPLKYYMTKMSPNRDKLKKLKFRKRSDKVKFYGFNIMHGDKGSGGSRGSTKNIEKFTYPAATAHQHGGYLITLYGNIASGCMLDYSHVGYLSEDGGINWIHAHNIIYPNGKGAAIKIFYPRGKQ